MKTKVAALCAALALSGPAAGQSVEIQEVLCLAQRGLASSVMEARQAGVSRMRAESVVDMDEGLALIERAWQVPRSMSGWGQSQAVADFSDAVWSECMARINRKGA